MMGNPGTYLWHLYLLDGADHVCRFFAPVTLHHVALYGSAVHRHDGVSRRLMGVEPGHRRDFKTRSFCKSYVTQRRERESAYLTNEYPLSGKTRISIIWPKGEKVCLIVCSVNRIKTVIITRSVCTRCSFTCSEFLQINGDSPVRPVVTPPQ